MSSDRGDPTFRTQVVRRSRKAEGKGPRLWMGLVLTVLVVSWAALPALAHGGEGESASVNLVEEALAIVVNTPDATGEALERVEEALEAEEVESSGELDVAALDDAAGALEEGRLHDAEDALVEALGQDPHARPAEPVSFSSAAADEGATAASLHGLTDRVDGGLRTPSAGGWTAIGLAVIAAAIGWVMVRRRETSI